MNLQKATFYNDPKFSYQKYWQGREYENRAEKNALRQLLANIPRKQNILDIGGGYGRFVPDYAPLFTNCLIIDPSQKHLNLAQEHCQNFHNLKLKLGLAEKIPLKDNRFQVVICIRTFHHLNDPQKAIQEFGRVLVPNGFLILEFANKIHFKNLLKSILNRHWDFITSHLPSSYQNKPQAVPFRRYHPNQILTLLMANNFVIKKTISVSNLRNSFFKKIFPLRVLLAGEALIAGLSSRCSGLKFFGPSIFVLAQIKKKPPANKAS